MALIANEDDLQTKFINGVVNGTNVPNFSEEDAIAKLKELGYDTSRIEIKKDKAPAEVVEMPKSSESNS